ncbi:MAG: hypothetical protein QOE18_1382 [Chloroflexota bacterium]|jgi:hypothetical protein|nr:hypothetical protein [Chloroflexota bacterium]
MSTIRPTARSRAGVAGLRANSMAAVVMLVIEFALGVVVNLYAELPPSDAGKTLLSAFGAAVTDGPVALTLHALLGTLLLITGISALVRASLLRRGVLIAVTGVALLAILLAWLSGTRFVGDSGDGESLLMALGTGAAIICYAAILFGATEPVDT